MSKPPAPEEDSGESTTAADQPVTRVEADLELVAPEDCCASVLLKQLNATGGLGSTGEIVFVWWLVAGRYGMRAAKVPYKHDNAYTIRVDVPRGIALSSSYLVEQLKLYWDDLPDLPPDTPVIKG